MKLYTSGWDFFVRATRQLFSRRAFVGEGFAIVPLTTWILLYKEGDRHLEIPTETLHGSTRWWDSWVGIHLDGPLMWKRPYAGEPIDSSRRTSIAANLAAAFEKLDEPYEIILP